ncbi:hypothetical protein [Mesorhizobium amorphae]|uniref:Uncharacterized protein n=1 Tax=Mesorhizobium amorphae CCNWGS0123 TaxID=1082933 RepID=G6YCT2_9HYPH|nr:hypothetical protein [Mesorhizobium amorphae]ANT52305.1 hypothetical protein A6B35_21665 [Mesorhizobium amorphae CCNWGS0123]EHH10404.1 hypothetical protein MEA186_18837 [Mesorhizobium amorphae CCNWGS0123]GLR44992.1 hypothetical protein GCM10007880_55090 [Mesorhizobium amorphae]
MQRLYIAVEKFGPSGGIGWKKYVEWSGLTQLTEVVTLDGMLCHFALPETKDTHWPHIVHEDNMLNFFVDLDFLLSELDDTINLNILGVIRRPSADVSLLDWDGFVFLGYDLMDKDVGNSALTNCGGFPEAFANSELSSVGLISNFERAVEIQRALRTKYYPPEHHADCDLWAIFRRQND